MSEVKTDVLEVYDIDIWTPHIYLPWYKRFWISIKHFFYYVCNLEEYPEAY